MRIREAIQEERLQKSSLLNYRKYRAPFWMLIQMCIGVSLVDGGVIHLMGVQVLSFRKEGLFGCEDGEEIHKAVSGVAKGCSAQTQSWNCGVHWLRILHLVGWKEVARKKQGVESEMRQLSAVVPISVALKSLSMACTS